LQAVAEIINEGRILEFSIKEVADRAGVSYGSVYRHFPTRESLLEALYEKASEMMAETSSGFLQSIEEIPRMARETVGIFEVQGKIVQAFTIALLANNIQPSSRKERDQRIEQLVLERHPELDQIRAREMSAVISHLYSSLTWTTLKGRFGLNGTEAANALNWALHILIQNIAEEREGLD
jgi:AcrR family transcriptional regulator